MNETRVINRIDGHAVRSVFVSSVNVRGYDCELLTATVDDGSMWTSQEIKTMYSGVAAGINWVQRTPPTQGCPPVISVASMCRINEFVMLLKSDGTLWVTNQVCTKDGVPSSIEWTQMNMPGEESPPGYVPNQVV